MKNSSDHQSATQSRPCDKRKKLLVALCTFALVVIVISASLLFTQRRNRNETSKNVTFCNTENEVAKLQGIAQTSRSVSTNNSAVDWEMPNTQFLRKKSLSPIDNFYKDYGCFYHDDKDLKSFLTHNLASPGGSTDSRAQECSNFCDTEHFAITSTKCHCYLTAPKKRINIGTCAAIPDTCLGLEDKIDAFMKVSTSEVCSQEKTSAVRNYFVEEDDAPFSYDIVSNTYRSSPFELSKDECGTNIYEVQTEVSSGSSTLTTTSKSVTDYANERKSNISSSIKASVSASGSAWLAKFSAKVSASADREANSLMKSSGATSTGSRVYTSFIVKRLAEVKILDFENKLNFVTFNKQFANLLRRYRDSGYDIDVAKEIFDKYGMFVVERGLFGGYRQIRATVNESDIKNYSSNESDFKACYELSVSAKASAFGASISGSTDVEGCSAQAKKVMSSLQDQYSEEVSTETLNGGKTEYSATGVPFFQVNPDDSILLTNKEHYPDGDDGIDLRPITEFLSSLKVSPLEVRRHLITEIQFDEIKTHLEDHMIDVLKSKLDILSTCTSDINCLLSFLTAEQESCSCYTPLKTSASWRLYTTVEQTVSNCLWDVKRIQFFASSNCSSDEISTAGGTSFSSGHKSYSSTSNAFKQSNIWAGLCRNEEYWIGMTFPDEVDIGCISVQNDNFHQVNSLTVQKKNPVSGVWESVAFKGNMNTSDQAVNIIQI